MIYIRYNVHIFLKFVNAVGMDLIYCTKIFTGGPNVSVPGIDYGNSTVVVTFRTGFSLSSYASIPIVPDDDVEGNEQFKATFELPGGYRNLTKGEPKEVVITIKDAVTGLTKSVCNNKSSRSITIHVMHQYQCSF